MMWSAFPCIGRTTNRLLAASLGNLTPHRNLNIELENQAIYNTKFTPDVNLEIFFYISPSK
jgi:hypothetical protein